MIQKYISRIWLTENVRMDMEPGDAAKVIENAPVVEFDPDEPPRYGRCRRCRYYRGSLDDAEQDGNCHYYMCSMHPEKLYGVDKADCIGCEWRVVVKKTMPRYNPDEFFNRQKPTNADRIRAMDDEELSALFVDVSFGCGHFSGVYSCKKNRRCIDCWLDWLKSPGEEKK